MKRKTSTPKTNAGYIQGVAIGPRFFNGGGPIADNVRDTSHIHNGRGLAPASSS
jgi:hypothetical protein